MDNKKKLSGAQNRKRKLIRDALSQKQAGALNKFIKRDKNVSDSAVDQSNTTEINYNDPGPSTSSSDNLIQEKDNETIELLEPQLDDGGKDTSLENINDIGKWPKLNEKLRVILIEMGPIQQKDLYYPRDSNGRKFSNLYYNRKMENGETVPRTWLLYSKALNSVYCFCCKLFSPIESSSLVEGFNDWRNLSKTLYRHETSANHMKNFIKWKEFSKNLKNKNTIDCQQQIMYDMEKKHGINVLTRLIEIVKFLSGQNLAFRGSSDKLYDRNNGNFLKLVELFAKFDPVMETHLEKVLKKSNSVHYLSKDIQNEILEILANEIRNKILGSIRESKYYSIILDCTPDASKTEQMTIVIRFVTCNNEVVEINENFLGFVNIDYSTGRGLYETIIALLAKWNLPIEDMRGQGYDNGANMKGKKNGLQNLILNKNNRAFFVPCAAHTLNLMINDAAKVNSDTISFFATVQEIYNFFSSSPKRWTILLQFISHLTLKQPSDTRWESKIKAIRPLRYQLGEIYDALFEILNNESFNNEVKNDARILCTKIKEYKFICSLIIWHDLLNRINPVSKNLQDKNMNLLLITKSIQNLKEYISEYRSDNNYTKILKIAKELSEDVDGEQDFKSITEIRQRKKKRQFEYEHEDEPPQTPENKFKVNVFYTLLDTAWNSLTERFDQLQTYVNYFSFLYNLYDINNEDLLKHCADLQIILTDGDNKDINANELYDEIVTYKDIFTTDAQKIVNPLDILKFIMSNNLSLPNFAIVLRILLTLPVSVASGERSFSKLKLIKTYLRTTMTQTRLDNLALISIENVICSSLDIKSIIYNFVNMKTRKLKF